MKNNFSLWRFEAKIKQRNELEIFEYNPEKEDNHESEKMKIE